MYYISFIYYISKIFFTLYGRGVKHVDTRKKIIYLSLAVVFCLAAIFIYNRFFSKPNNDNGADAVRESIKSVRETDQRLNDSISKANSSFRDVVESSNEFKEQLGDVGEQQQELGDNIRETEEVHKQLENSVGGIEETVNRNTEQQQAVTDSIDRSQESTGELEKLNSELSAIEQSNNEQYKQINRDLAETTGTIEQLRQSIADSKSILNSIESANKRDGK